MAKVISKRVDSDVVNDTIPIFQVVMIGAVLGLVYWLLTLVFSRYISSLGVAGDISTILVATLGVVIMLNLHMVRPLLVAVAVAVSLWGLSRLTNGLTEIEILFWYVFLYGLAYALFYWLNRYNKFVPVLIATIIIITIARITTTL